MWNGLGLIRPEQRSIGDNIFEVRNMEFSTSVHTPVSQFCDHYALELYGAEIN